MAEGPSPQALDQPDRGRHHKPQLFAMSPDVPDDASDLLEDDAGTALAVANVIPQESPYHLVLVTLDNLRHWLPESVMVGIMVLLLLLLFQNMLLLLSWVCLSTVLEKLLVVMQTVC